MDLKPSENTQLYGMNHFFNEITTLYNEKKMPTKILLSGNSGIDLSRGKYEIERMRLESKEILEDLIVAAHNDAKSKIKKKTSEEISKATGGINLPPGFKLPF